MRSPPLSISLHDLTGSMMTSESRDSPMSRTSPVRIPVTYRGGIRVCEMDAPLFFFLMRPSGPQYLHPTRPPFMIFISTILGAAPPPSPPSPSHQRPPLAAVVDHALHRHHLRQHSAHLGGGCLKDRVDEDKVEVLGACEGQLQQLDGETGLTAPAYKGEGSRLIAPALSAEGGRSQRLERAEMVFPPSPTTHGETPPLSYQTRAPDCPPITPPPPPPHLMSTKPPNSDGPTLSA